VWKEAGEYHGETRHGQQQEPELIVARPAAAGAIAETGGDPSEAGKCDGDLGNAL
jgi:hypothetical protein